ncbi:MAG: hypothetical protein KZQ83_01485 [gamma proteobacterium symbiont of Taylorina sp.]|nr:hypothetical protein [gamma proteobacterium symbiont of Taylorina sp.]
MIKIDTGKAIITPFNEKDNIILIDIYVDGELQVNDVNNIHKAIEKCNLQIPVDTICVKSGENYLSEEAFKYSMEKNCIHNKVVYVIKHMADIHFPSQVQESYFKTHFVDFCSSIDEAYRLIKN